MGEEGQLVRGLVLLALAERLFDISRVLRDRPTSLARLAQVLPDIRGGDGRVRSLVPADVERLKTLLRRPHVIADDRDHVVQHDHLAHARNPVCGAGIHVGHLAAKHRTCRKGRKFHPGQHHVDSIDDTAVDLVRCIKTLERLANQREILGVLERRILRRCKFAGRADQGAKPRLPSAADVPHLAIGRGATRGVDLPALCRRLNQHGARRGTRLAQRLPERTDGVGVTGDLDTEDGVAVELVVGWRVFQYDLLVIGVQFLGEDHGDRCVDALTHLNLRHYERRPARRIDANERVGREFAFFTPLGRLARPIRRQMEGQQEATRKPSAKEAAA